ncbi:MAG TPA: dTMP kinase [Nitrosospira sp.]|nr:dTMP kinase [Nitrosospira sp.]
MPRGKFITLEGIDGAGKSTQIARLADLLRERGKTVVVTREPGGTSLGERLRELLLDNCQTMHPETEALLMFAARREHLDKVILPALEQGNWVICDRFTDASFAYQGGGRGLPAEKLAELERWVQGNVQPDLTLYFDITSELGRLRTSGVKNPDRFEREHDEFFRRVRDGYLDRAYRFPERILVVDAGRSLEEVNRTVEDIAISYCK